MTCWWSVEELEPQALLVGMSNGAAALAKLGSSSKLKTEVLPDAAILLLGAHHWSEAGAPTDLRTPMFSAAVLALGRGGRRPKCPSMGRWTNKTWPGPAVE